MKFLKFLKFFEIFGKFWKSWKFLKILKIFKNLENFLQIFEIFWKFWKILKPSLTTQASFTTLTHTAQFKLGRILYVVALFSITRVNLLHRFKLLSRSSRLEVDHLGSKCQLVLHYMGHQFSSHVDLSTQIIKQNQPNQDWSKTSSRPPQDPPKT